MIDRHSMLFVSPTFLYPIDTGGRIRTTQVLRGLSGGRFDVVLGSPATADELRRHEGQMKALCSRYFSWQVGPRNAWFRLARMRHLVDELPIPVVTDYSRSGAAAIAAELKRGPSVALFDFPHSMVLAPERVDVPLVLFTHNVEAEIFARHEAVAADPLRRAIWRNQHRKMSRFERRVVERADLVIGVSERDCEFLRSEYGAMRTVVIPTGTDIEFFDYQAPGREPCIVFCGSMDWMANIEGIEWFMDAVWPLVAEAQPAARMRVVGRSPPASLVRRAEQWGDRWEFTGWVDDVRPHVQGGSAFVIPLRVAGGTRLKVFEAMSMGVPVVSTAIGVEGLPLEDGRHYLEADEPAELAAALVSTLQDAELRNRLSFAGRDYVEREASFRRAAGVFEEACLSVVRRG